MTEADVRHRLKACTERTSIADVARDLEVSPSLLSMVISGDRDLSDALLKKLGLRRVTRYERTARSRI